MQDQTKGRELGGPALQRAVIGLALATYPRREMTIAAMEERIGHGGVEHAVRVLVGVGLLEDRGNLVRPSPAALHVEQLEMAWLRQ